MKSWRAPLLVGAVLRLIAAAAGYGFFASDDYRYALEPAWREMMFGASGPASGIRSVVFAKALAQVMSLWHALGVRDPTWLVRGVYLVLGAYALLAIPGLYRLTETTLGVRAASIAAWLMACEALMPRLSTRALIEMAAIPPLVWGMALTAEAVKRDSWQRAGTAGLLLGIAAMLRYQVGLVGACVVACLLVARRPRLAAAMTATGLVALLTQGLIDLKSHGAFLATLVGYVRFNAERSSSFGTAPWFTYVVMLMLITLPPLTFWLAKPLWRAYRKAPLIGVPLGVFVIVHSIIPHKEERFLFSVLPLAFALLAFALSEVKRPVAIAFWVVNGLGLIVATLSDGQRNIIDPLVTAPADARIAVIGGYEVPQLYAGAREVSRYADAASIPAAKMRIIVSQDEMPVTLPTTVTCATPLLYEGDVVDRVLVWINRKGNGRRSAKVAIDCQP